MSENAKRLVDTLKNKYGAITVYTYTHNIHKKNGDYNYTRVELPYNAVLRMVMLDDDLRRSITAVLCLRYKDAEDEETRQRILVLKRDHTHKGGDRGGLPRGLHPGPG
ncbi:hypothetical protein [Vulcanisaeta sp. JCM 14467]|uniref:hypothetical protein n=1 Tax=Vulcanisaeta sp. JCM 14467 TaxID=1295370 RepID=UPI0006D21B2B|nr:hypothetical protein [Vulcanisaeta sp. JCM 14467]